MSLPYISGVHALHCLYDKGWPACSGQFLYMAHCHVYCRSAFYFCSKHCGQHLFNIKSVFSQFLPSWGGLEQSVLVTFAARLCGSRCICYQRTLDPRELLKWKGLGFMMWSQFLGELICQISWWEVLSPALAGVCSAFKHVSSPCWTWIRNWDCFLTASK